MSFLQTVSRMQCNIRKLILAVWLVAGLVYAATTLAAELCWKHGYAIATAAQNLKGDVTAELTAALAEGLEWAERAAWWAPELFWIRSTPSNIAIVNPVLPDRRAIEIFRDELKYDPYDTQLWFYLTLRLAHDGQWDKAWEAHARVKQIWPNSPIDQGLETILTSLMKKSEP